MLMVTAIRCHGDVSRISMSLGCWIR